MGGRKRWRASKPGWPVSRSPFLAILLALTLIRPALAEGAERELVILHTNDLQSRLLGFAPNRDYTPLTTGDDDTVGGIARLATLVAERRASAPDKTLLLDGGDIMMGTLFQSLGPLEGSEFQLLGRLGYDAAVLGNHDFDFGPEGLAQTIDAARAVGPIPALLIANLVFDPEQSEDDALEALMTAGVIRESVLIERGGLRIGLFGLMGRDAADVSSYARPLRFADPVETARRLTTELRGAGAEVVICLSHGGVLHRRDGGWGGEDPELLRQVPGIDVVVGGHSHTPLPEPVLVDGRPVVQAGSEGQYLGELHLLVGDGGVTVQGYELLPVDDRILGDPEVHALVEGFERRIDQEILAPYGLTFGQALLETPEDLRVTWRDPAASGLGPLVADALRRAAGRDGQPVDVALTTAGLVRDHLLRGKSGIQQLSDLYRVLPLGIGLVDQSPGYPLLRVYLTGRELRTASEVMLFGWRSRGANFYPFLSGLRARYHPHRPPLDRIFDLRLDRDGTLEPIDPDRLYSLAVSTFVLESFPLIGKLSHGLVSVVPKDAEGRPITDPADHLIDADPTTPGLQEVKEWMALVELVATFPDTDGDGIPEVPGRYGHPDPRLIEEASLHPKALFGNSTRILRTVVGLPLALIALVLFALRRRARRRKG